MFVLKILAFEFSIKSIFYESYFFEYSNSKKFKFLFVFI